MRQTGLSLLALAVALGPAACLQDDGPTGEPGARVEIAVAPLSLSSVTEATYELIVYNADADVVLQRTLGSRQYGAGDGSVSFVGTCDADRNDNVVALELLALYEGAAGDQLVDPSTYVNPGVLTRPFTCLDNEDVAIDIDLSIARQANQGFFDVGVDFNQVFCSAKLDCGSDLLFDGTERGPTAVVAMACTGGLGGVDTHLYRDDLVVTCLSGETATVDPSAGPGNLAEGAGITDPSGVLFGAAVYRGVEQLGYDKAYWNVLLGLNEGPATSCRLVTRATASDEALTGGQTPDGASWPYLEWNVTLTGADGLVACGHHPVNGVGAEAGVSIAYTSLSEPRTFPYAYAGPGLPVAAPAAECLDLLEAGQTADGVYQIDPDGVGGDDPIDVYCDMTGGGWTLFGFWDSAFDYGASHTAALGVDGATDMIGAKPDGAVARLVVAGAGWSFDVRASDTGAFTPSDDASYTGLAFETVAAATGATIDLSQRHISMSFSDTGYLGDHFLAVSGGFGSVIDGVSYTQVGGGCTPMLGMYWVVSQGASGGYNVKNTMDVSHHLNCSNSASGLSATSGALYYRTGTPTPTTRVDCLAHRDAGETADGAYAIDPDGDGGDAPFDVYCDMTTAGGGWTLAAIFTDGDGVVHWNSDAAWGTTATFGDLSSVGVEDLKSPAFYALDATDVLMTTKTQADTDPFDAGAGYWRHSAAALGGQGDLMDLFNSLSWPTAACHGGPYSCASHRVALTAAGPNGASGTTPDDWGFSMRNWDIDGSPGSAVAVYYHDDAMNGGAWCNAGGGYSAGWWSSPTDVGSTLAYSGWNQGTFCTRMATGQLLLWLR